MDYEKKYTHALEVVRELQKDWASSQNRAAREIELAFPELRESKDERIRKWLYDYISNCPNNNFAFYGGVGKDAVLNYLEKQKERKPAEWSEEDERKRNGLIKGLEDRMGFGWASDPFSREEYISWLKSLRPQPHWKPSEEQMNFLCSAVDAAIRKHNESVSGYEPAGVLRSLYEQLKKL